MADSFRRSARSTRRAIPAVLDLTVQQQLEGKQATIPDFSVRGRRLDLQNPLFWVGIVALAEYYS